MVAVSSKAKPGAGLHDASLGVSLALTGFVLAHYGKGPESFCAAGQVF